MFNFFYFTNHIRIAYTIKMIADINITGVCGFALLRLISTDSVSVDLVISGVVNGDKSANNICPSRWVLSALSPQHPNSNWWRFDAPFCEHWEQVRYRQCAWYLLAEEGILKSHSHSSWWPQHLTTEGSYRDYRFALIVVWCPSVHRTHLVGWMGGGAFP
jgi:hypothetical protein